ncbi:MAG: VCBS repeat-containing protein [Planctomycetaceae bacterium]|nr:VCBS repeat-containing protein [Planctomycetaceae bacterium]
MISVRRVSFRLYLAVLLASGVQLSCSLTRSAVGEDPPGEQHLLYVASPGIRNYLEYGGHGLLVFDIDHDHRFVRRIPIGGLNDQGVPINIKGVCASAATGRIYLTTLSTMMCLDLITDELLWEKSYEGGCDRMAISPDGKVIYLPSLEKDHWHVVDAITGDVITRLDPRSGAHNTVYGPDGKWAYLAGLRSPVLSISDTSSHTITRTCGPFSNSIRPFTINGDQSLVFVCINDCLGFEIGDLKTGKMLHRVDVKGFEQGPVKRHGCPSHGIGLSPDENELWVTDGHNSQMHVFDATVMPPQQVASIAVRDQPGWVTFSIDGRYAYPSSGEVIERSSRKIAALLTDEEGRAVGSEKMLQIDFAGGRPVRTGNQFGIGSGIAVSVEQAFSVPSSTGPASPQSRDSSLSFQQHVIDGESTMHSCAAIDINRDGRLDVVTGGAWYERPATAGAAWKKHPVRDVEQIRGRFDDYSCLPVDVNGDGLLDLVSVNYRSESIYWVQNPGPDSLTAWQKHDVAKPGAMETGRLADVDGDGTLDILPNGVKSPAWFSLVPGPEPRWAQHALPEELAGHGIGFGDLNGDGRGDVVGRFGWAEAPEDRRNDRWQFHPEFELERDASIPILVHDVNDDGMADVIYGRGHHTGLYWLQQVKNDDGRSWIRHAIDTSWSQPHSLLMADLNGDGRQDLIAGKRFMGHDGKDPGEYNPVVSYWYEFQNHSMSWKRHLIDHGDTIGAAFGLDPKAVDLDGDGDLDLISADRNGLFYLENTGAVAARPTPDSVWYPDHTNITTVRDVDGVERPVTTPFDAGRRRTHILDAMSRAMGPLPPPEQRVPLAVQIDSKDDAGKYMRYRISYSPEPDDRVPAWLLIPKDRAGRGPAMLCLHQTTGIGKGEPAGLGGLPDLHYAHELAERGFVCLAPDYPSFGDYPYDFQTKGSHYASGSMKAIWNNIRAIDLLESLPEVDADRIGCIGHSLGGHNTLFTAAFDLRIRAAVTSCGFTAFHHYYEGHLAGWTSDRYMPRIRDLYHNSPDEVPFDFHEVLAAISPRAIFVCAPTGDSNFEVTGVRKVIHAVTATYEVYGADLAGKFPPLVARYPECGHQFPPETRYEAYDWLQQQLK